MKCRSILEGGNQCKNNCLFDGHCWRHSKQTCAICMENTSAKRNLTSHRLQCGHAFHRRCISNWFIHSDLCPTCRKSQHRDPLIKFKHHVENKMRSTYQGIISSLEQQNEQLRMQQYQMYNNYMGMGYSNPYQQVINNLPRGNSM